MEKAYRQESLPVGYEGDLSQKSPGHSSHILSDEIRRGGSAGESSPAREAGKVSIFSFCRRKQAKNKGVREATHKVFQKNPKEAVTEQIRTGNDGGKAKSEGRVYKEDPDMTRNTVRLE